MSRREIHEVVDNLEQIAASIKHTFTKPLYDKKSESVCDLCEEGIEDLKYGPIHRKDKVAALEELAEKLLEWKKPDEAWRRLKTYADGYNSLVEERHLAMRYHGLDVEFKE